VPRIYCHSVDPLCVSELTAPQKEVVCGEGYLHARLQVEVPIKLVEEFVGTSAVDLSRVKVHKDVCLSAGHFHHIFVGLFMLQVSLAVQILSLYVTYALSQRRVKQDHIAGEKLIFFDHADRADLNRRSTNLFESSLPTSAALCGPRVLLIILRTPFIVFKGVFDHRHAYHEQQWHEHDWFAARVRDGLVKLHHTEEKEVEVCHLSELNE